MHVHRVACMQSYMRQHPLVALAYCNAYVQEQPEVLLDVTRHQDHVPADELVRLQVERLLVRSRACHCYPLESLGALMSKPHAMHERPWCAERMLANSPHVTRMRTPCPPPRNNSGSICLGQAGIRRPLRRCSGIHRIKCVLKCVLMHVCNVAARAEGWRPC